MATRLYPPITEEVLPAFCLTYDDNGDKIGVTININFELNKAVAASEVGGIVLRLRTISTNKYIVDENMLNPNLNLNISGVENEGYAISKDVINGNCIFQISSENNPDVINALHVGQYYKAQLAFVDLNQVVGYWSNVATIKCVAAPTVSVANYTVNDANIFSNEILGLYVQDTEKGDSSEKVYSYRFQLWDNNGDIIDDSGVKLHNSSADTSSFSSTDSFVCHEELKSNTVYYLQYSVTTINGLNAFSPVYQIIAAESLDMEDNLTLLVSNGLEKNYWSDTHYNRNLNWAPWEEGVIRITPEVVEDLNSETHTKLVTGTYVLLRSSSKDNFSSWEEVRRFRLTDEIPYNKIIYDYTIEQGISYKYALQQYNRAGFYSKKVYMNGEDSILADFEDMFLYDGERQLKIRFNPKVSSFKNDLQEQKIDTIGSKYPFIFRNGNICYKEFPISGLISFQEDSSLFFIDDEDYEQMGLERFELKRRHDSEPSREDFNLKTNKTNLTSENIMSERYFKLKVLDWLTDGKPKLFRSPTEGNYIVRLLNVSLTPKTELGRMIHEFTCTAYEIADFNYDSLINLGLLNVTDKSVIEYQWRTYNIKDLFTENSASAKDGFYNVNLKERNLVGVECINFAPGDQIKILLQNSSEPLIITIGQTGTYIYEGATPIISLSIKPVNNTGDFNRDLLLATQGYIYKKFDMISSIGMYTQVGTQLVGPVENYFQPTVVNKFAPSPEEVDLNRNDVYYQSNHVYLSKDGDTFNGVKLKPSELLYLHAQKREIVPIFLGGIDNAINDHSLEINLSKKIFMLSPFNNGYIRYKSISTDDSSNFEYGILSVGEREEEKTLGNLLQIVYEQLMPNSFCLFQVYTPHQDAVDAVSYWAKYYGTHQVASTSLIGIYDPWRAQQKKNEREGWWKVSEYSEDYDPTFSYNDSIIDLSQEEEITIKNLSVPDVLRVGNGVMMELIYRITYTDYILESEDPELRELKEKYLIQKENGIEKMSLWRTANFAAKYGDILISKYTVLLNKIQDYTAYSDVVKELTEAARQQQNTNLINYFNDEQRFVNSIINQIRSVDLDLLTNLDENEEDSTSGYKNSAFRIFPSTNNNLLTAKTSYDNQIQTFKSQGNHDTLIYDINNISEFSVFNTEEQKRLKQIRDLYNHISSSSNYNFFHIIESIKNNLKLNVIDEIQREYEDLGNKTYVSQYIDIMEAKAKEIFFGEETKVKAKDVEDYMKLDSADMKYLDSNNNIIYPVKNENNIINESFANPVSIEGKYIYELLNISENNLSSIKSNLMNKSILSSDWDNTFYLTNNLPNIGYRGDTNNSAKRILNNNGQAYLNGDLSQQIKNNCWLGSYSNEGKSLISYINDEFITAYNNKVVSGENDDLKESFDNFFAPYKIEDDFMINDIDKYDLLNISNNGDIFSNSNLSALQSILINLSVLSKEENETDEDFLNNTIWPEVEIQSEISSLPNMMKDIVKQMIYFYILEFDNINEIYSKRLSCINYYNEHIDQLSSEQKNFISNQIKSYNNQLKSYREKEFANDDIIISDISEVTFTNGVYNLQLKQNNKINSIKKLYDILGNNIRHYVSMQQKKEVADLGPYAAILHRYQNYFNKIIELKNSAIFQFNIYRDRLRYIYENYNASSNIKEILFNELIFYKNAYSELEEISNNFRNNITNLQSSVEVVAYLQFLEIYIEYLKNRSAETQDKINEYKQLLANARAMKAISVNDEYSYENQQRETNKAWKAFLDKLAEVYENEIKEKMV